MTTINESRTAKGFTPAALVPAAFGRPRTIEGIVIHWWGAYGQQHEDVVKFFVDGPGATSAHFVVSAGRIDCIVSPQDAAWHSGNAVGNATTIGIECRPEATDADYETVAELVRYLRDQYGDLPLSPHRQWNATACPGIWDLDRIDQLAGTPTINPQSTEVQEDDMALSYEDKLFIQNAIEDKAVVTRRLIIEELAKKIEDGNYDVKVFTQATDNSNADRVINKLEEPK